MERENLPWILFIGIGGVGGFYGGSFAKNSPEELQKKIFFLGRAESSHTKKLESDGLKVECNNGRDSFHVKINLLEQCSTQKFDVIFCCTKSGALNDLLEPITKFKHDDTLIIPLLNGIMPSGENFHRSHFFFKSLKFLHLVSSAFGEEFLADKFGDCVCGGYCKVISFIKEDGLVFFFENPLPRLAFGPLPSTNKRYMGRIEQMKKLVASAGLPMEQIGEDIRQGVWQKFIYISSKASVTSVCRSTFQEVMANEEGRELLRDAVKEVYSLALKKKVPLEENFDQKVFQLFLNEAATSLTPNTSSMQRDIMVRSLSAKKKMKYFYSFFNPILKEGKPSELFEITGYVVNEGKKLGVETPSHKFILYSLMSQEMAARKKTENK